MKRKIAWGYSKLLYLYCAANRNNLEFEFIIDDFTEKTELDGLPVFKSDCLSHERNGEIEIVIFAMSNAAIIEIFKKLHRFGLSYRSGFLLYSDLLSDDVERVMINELGWEPDRKLLEFATSFNLNSRKNIHTSIVGNWVFLEALKAVGKHPGNIAEVGIYEGGNALCSLQSSVFPAGKKFYLLDSFEGFPGISEADPATCSKGTYKIQVNFAEILDSFAAHTQCKIIKGFVPDTFSQLPEDERFSLVLFDCDLYQATLDTLAWFWDRMVPGGIFLIHDYFYEEGGFSGVSQAVNEFTEPRGIRVFGIWQGTMGILLK